MKEIAANLDIGGRKSANYPRGTRRCLYLDADKEFIPPIFHLSIYAKPLT
jgi:hypothetical protein